MLQITWIAKKIANHVICNFSVLQILLIFKSRKLQCNSRDLQFFLQFTWFATFLYYEICYCANHVNCSANHMNCSANHVICSANHVNYTAIHMITAALKWLIHIADSHNWLLQLHHLLNKNLTMAIMIYCDSRNPITLSGLETVHVRKSLSDCVLMVFSVVWQSRSNLISTAEARSSILHLSHIKNRLYFPIFYALNYVLLYVPKFNKCTF